MKQIPFNISNLDEDEKILFNGKCYRKASYYLMWCLIFIITFLVFILLNYKDGGSFSKCPECFISSLLIYHGKSSFYWVLLLFIFIIPMELFPLQLFLTTKRLALFKKGISTVPERLEFELKDLKNKEIKRSIFKGLHLTVNNENKKYLKFTDPFIKRKTFFMDLSSYNIPTFVSDQIISTSHTHKFSTPILHPETIKKYTSFLTYYLIGFYIFALTAFLTSYSYPPLSSRIYYPEHNSVLFFSANKLNHLFPDNKLLLIIQIQILLAKEHNQEALTLLNKLVKLDPTNTTYTEAQTLVQKKLETK